MVSRPEHKSLSSAPSLMGPLRGAGCLVTEAIKGNPLSGGLKLSQG